MKTPRLLSLLTASSALFVISPLAIASQADDTTVTITGQNSGPTPFISKLSLHVSDLPALSRIKFAVRPKLGSATRPLAATYSKIYLGSRGYLNAEAGDVTVPVFGLYDGYNNTVTLTYLFADGSSRDATTEIMTLPFDDPCHYNAPTVFKPRTAGEELSYDFFLVTTNCSGYSPKVLDTDGAIRWVGTASRPSYTSTFYHNGVYLAAHGVIRMELDGAVSRVDDRTTLEAIGLHHSIDRGKYGLIVDVDTKDWVESVNVEIDGLGHVLNRWVIGDIIRQAMIDGGDDPTDFVRNAKGRYDFLAHEDWFHNNSTAYRKSDDSLILSSRENFVICIDYESGAIKWILGDPKKAWYQYPSLRKYALELTPGTHPPIGQHTVSITKDDHLLLFDNGNRSQNHIPKGPSRTYSTPRKYALDLEARTATEVWNYPNGYAFRPPFRSSVYEDEASNYIVHYWRSEKNQRIFGLNASGEKVFDYAFHGDAFRSIPVHWERLMFLTPAPERTPEAASAERAAAGEEN